LPCSGSLSICDSHARTDDGLIGFIVERLWEEVFPITGYLLQSMVMAEHRHAPAVSPRLQPLQTLNACDLDVGPWHPSMGVPATEPKAPCNREDFLRHFIAGIALQALLHSGKRQRVWLMRSGDGGLPAQSAMALHIIAVMDLGRSSAA